MTDSDSLIITETHRPQTIAGGVGLVMLVVSGHGLDTQWFDYRPGFFQDIVRVEWDRDTMAVVLPTDVSEYLLRNGYARAMTNKEAKVYNNGVAIPPRVTASETPSQKPKEDDHDQDQM